jgi:O-antigen/teichoic acid export membrane protein
MTKPALSESIGRSRYATALRSIGEGTFWVAVGAAAGQGATLVANILVANALEPARFGAYAFLLSTQNALALIAQLSLGLAATKYLPNWRVQEPQRAGEFLGFGTAFTAGLGLLVAAGFAAIAVIMGIDLGLAQPEALRVMLLAAAVVPLLGLILFQSGALIGFEAFRAYAILSVVTAIFAVALPALGARIYDVQGAICGLALVALLRAAWGRTLIAGRARAHGMRAVYTPSRAMVRLLFDFALPGSLTVAVAGLAQWAVGSLILHQRGAAQFALYAVAFSIRQVVLFVPVQLASVSLALMSNRAGRADAAGHSTVFAASLSLTLAAAGAIALIVGLAARPVLAMFGPAFVAGESLLRLMLVSAFLEAAATSAYQILPARGLMWTSLKWVGLPRDLTLLLVASLAVPQFGDDGGAAALILSQLVALTGIWLVSRSAPGTEDST